MAEQHYSGTIVEGAGEQDDDDSIVVTSKRLKDKPDHSPEPRLNVTVNVGGYVGTLNDDPFSRYVRSWIGDSTHFDISKTFEPRQKLIIEHIVREMTNLPEYRDRMKL